MRAPPTGTAKARSSTVLDDQSGVADGGDSAVPVAIARLEVGGRGELLDRHRVRRTVVDLGQHRRAWRPQPRRPQRDDLGDRERLEGAADSVQAGLRITLTDPSVSTANPFSTSHLLPP
jgi:hypothetical protein